MALEAVAIHLTIVLTRLGVHKGGSLQNAMAFIECVIKLIATLLIVFGSRWARAEDIALSVRAVGMGNAFTAIVDNHDSVFYNPAGLAKQSGFGWTILDPAIGINNIDSYSEYSDILDTTGSTANLLNQFYGEAITAYLGGNKTMMNIGGLTFGAYGLSNANFLLSNPAYPSMNAMYNVDYGFVVGWGMEFVPQMFALGLQARKVTRQGGTVPIGVSTLATLNSQDIEDQLNRTGSAYAADLGANLSFPVALNPTFSFVWRDMGMTTFKNDDPTKTPPARVNQEMILGLGFKWDSTLMGISTAFDYRYSNDTDMQLGKKLNFGMEFNFPLLDVRGGFHQGYLSYGASFDMLFMRIDAASYSVELGEYPGQLEDRRYMLQVTFEFGIDPSLDFAKISRPGALNNHKRKQRR